MPFPSPRKNEEKNDFISRCIEYEENQDTDMTHEQIQAACYQKWRDEREEKALKAIFSVVKEESLDKRLASIRDSWYENNRPSEVPVSASSDGYVSEVFDDYVIVRTGGKLYRYPYKKTSEGIEFGEPTEVEQVYVEKEEKALGEGQGVGGDRQGIGGAERCVCPECDYSEKHERNTPCSEKKCPKCGATMVGAQEDSMEEKAKWSTAYVNSLDDSAFLYIEPGGEKDDEGKTKPRSLRHLPYKNSDGNIDLPHLRNAISRLGQAATGKNWKGFTAAKRKSLQNKAQKILEEETDKEEKAVEKEFVLQKHNWPGVLETYELTFKEQDGDLWVLTFSENPLESAPISGQAVRKGADESELIEKDQVTLSPGSPRNPTESTPCAVQTLDRGSYDLVIKERDHRTYKLEGEKLQGVWTFDGPGRWKMDNKGFKQVWNKFGEFVEKMFEPHEEPANQQLFITKDAKTGRARWTQITSTAFLDREGDIVSREAIDKSISRAEDEGEYGEFTFWHTPIKIGECDFQARSGVCLVESGLFDETPIGKAVSERIEDYPEDYWGASLEFKPLKTRHDVLIKGRKVNRLWEDINIVRRSLLPQMYAAANHTKLFVRGGKVDTQKKDTLIELVGSDLAAKVLEQVSDVNKGTEEPEAVFKDRLAEFVDTIEDKEIKQGFLDVLNEVAEELDGKANEPAADASGEEESEVMKAVSSIADRLENIEKELEEVKNAPRAAQQSTYRASEDEETGIESKENFNPNDVVARVASRAFSIED